MEHFTILILASSDLENTDKPVSINLKSDIIDLKLPCNKYKGTGKKCSSCHYNKYEHKIGYPLNPPNSTKIKIDKQFTSLSEYSDFWKTKYMIFSKIKEWIPKNKLKNSVISYQTLDPLYKKNSAYSSTINKINNNINKKLGFKEIKRGKPNHYPNYLHEIYNTKFKEKYNMIIIINGGIGDLITPDNMDIIYNMLKVNGFFAHIYNSLWKKAIYKTELDMELEFNTPLSVCIPLIKNTISTQDKECIKNYSKMLLDNKFSYLENGIYLKR